MRGEGEGWRPNLLATVRRAMARHRRAPRAAGAAFGFSVRAALAAPSATASAAVLRLVVTP